MNQKRHKRVFQPYHAAVLLLSLVLLTSHFVTGLYARYLTGSENVYSAHVAQVRYAVKNEGEAPQTYYFELSDRFAPDEDNGDKISVEPDQWYCYYYRFSVTNASDAGVSEVAFRYEVTLKLNQTEEMLSFAEPAANIILLYDDDPVFTPGSLGTDAEGYSTVTFSGVMPAGELLTASYVVQVYVRTDELGQIPESSKHRIDYLFHYTQVN